MANARSFPALMCSIAEAGRTVLACLAGEVQ